jgi:hypothetical protein
MSGLAERIERLKIMAEKYRANGNDLAAERCEAQIRQLERHEK